MKSREGHDMGSEPKRKSDQHHDHNAIQEARFSLWLITLLLVLVYAWQVYANPGLHTSSRLVAFSVVLLLHAGLRWRGYSYSLSKIPVYLGIQAALVLGLSLLSQSSWLALILVLFMISEAASLLENLSHALAATACFLLLFLFILQVIDLQDEFLPWFVGSLALALSLPVFIHQARRKSIASDPFQAVLKEIETVHDQGTQLKGMVITNVADLKDEKVMENYLKVLAEEIAGLILQLETLVSLMETGDSIRSLTVAKKALHTAYAIMESSPDREFPGFMERKDGKELADATREEVIRFMATTDIRCSLDLSELPRVPDAIHQCAIQVIEMWLSSIARYAQASEANVRLGSQEGWLLVEIFDNGKGFDPLLSARQISQYGLLGMQERAQFAGGTLQITSSPGVGTTLRLKLPLGENPG